MPTRYQRETARGRMHMGGWIEKGLVEWAYREAEKHYRGNVTAFLEGILADAKQHRRAFGKLKVYKGRRS